MNKRSAQPPRLTACDHERTYRQRVCRMGMHAFQVVCQETDLMIQADRLLEDEAREEVLACRGQIDGYIQRYPEFAVTLKPWRQQAFAPEIVRAMIEAGSNAGVGPMAAVAGAVAETVDHRRIGNVLAVLRFTNRLDLDPDPTFPDAHPVTGAALNVHETL